MEEIRSSLALHRAPGVGPVLFQHLIDRFGSATGVLASAGSLKPEGRLNAATIEYLRTPDWAAVEADLIWSNRPGNTILLRSDPHYPYLLAHIHDPPPLLFVHGDKAVLNQPKIAIVGSRNPSPLGYDTAKTFAQGLVRAGLVVTSGMAHGIDAAGHEGALAGGGSSIAVAGTGLDRVYPARHHELAHRIAGNGALVSEYPPGTPPIPANFPRRNRIISGLCVGVLVVEASINSGSLITARLALEQGREVFAIPGSIHNPLTRGCHALIREGAKLVESVKDILEELKYLIGTVSLPPQVITEVPLDDQYQTLLTHLGHDPAPIDDLIARSGLTSASVSSMLLILELRGLVVAQPGGLYSRVASRQKSATGEFG